MSIISDAISRLSEAFTDVSDDIGYDWLPQDTVDPSDTTSLHVLVGSMLLATAAYVGIEFFDPPPADVRGDVSVVDASYKAPRP